MFKATLEFSHQDTELFYKEIVSKFRLFIQVEEKPTQKSEALTKAHGILMVG